MFRDSENQHSADAGRPSDGSGSTSPPPGVLRRNALLIIGLVCLGIAAYQYLWPSPKLPVPEPADWSQVEPQARAYLQELVKQTQEDARHPANHAQMGLAYCANGLWDVAVPCFENTAKLAPKEPLAPYYLAIALAQSGDQERAREVMKDLTERFPEFPQGFQRLGELALADDQFDAATAAFTRLTELAPDEWRGYAGLGEVSLKQEKAAEAIPLLEKAVQKDPSAGSAQRQLGLAYQQVGRTNEAAQRLQGGYDATRYPMPDPWSATLPQHMRLQRDLAALAQSLVAGGQAGQAVSMLTNALSYDSNSVLLLSTLGLARHHAGDAPGAWLDLQRVIQIETNNVPALVALSAVAISLGDVTNALDTAERAVALAPEAPQPFLAKANAELARSNNVAAIAALRQALVVAPGSGSIHMDIANILLMNEDKATEALAEYEQAIQREPWLIPAHVRIAQIRLREGRTNDALAAIRTARQYAPNDTNLVMFEQAILSPPPPPASTAPTEQP